VDYKLSLMPAQNWIHFVTLQIKCQLTFNSGVSTAGFDLYIHDAAGGYKYLGWYGGANAEVKTAAVNITSSTPRNQVDQVLIRVHESYFGAQGVPGKSLRFHLYNISTVADQYNERFTAWMHEDYYSTHGNPTMMHGIPTMVPHRQKPQPRQLVDSFWGADNWLGTSVAVTSQLASNWAKTNLMDGNPATAWSSVGHPGKNYYEHIGFWFSPRYVSALKLVPRTSSQGQAMCVPESVTIYYSTPAGWQLLKTVALDANPKQGSTSYPIFFNPVYTDGFLIATNNLRPDQYNNYYFQMADVYAAYTKYIANIPADTQWAAAHPGELYIFGDEPDVLGIAAADYAEKYHDYVIAMRTADPTARFSPAGFSQPSSDPNRTIHFTDYAQQFWDAYNAKYGTPPPVDEWRFHVFSYSTDLTTWKSLVNSAVSWSSQHGAPMVLGSFGFPPPSNTDVRTAERDMMRFIAAKPQIVSAVWYDFEPRSDAAHTINKDNGNLSPEGQVFLEETWR
jgi:hypothetical protein